MKPGRRPIVLISPGVSTSGTEFSDLSISLSDTYGQALADNGAMPLVLVATASPAAVRDSVAVADGIVLSGGDDIDPELYEASLPASVRKTVHVTHDGGKRDLFELLLLNETFRQRKPLLAICRGHQLLNVALGGDLIADIPSQVPHAFNHRRRDKRDAVVHEVRLTEDSLLAKITGTQLLGANSTHHQAVGIAADPLMVTASSSDGVVEGLEFKPEYRGLLPFLLSVQFHPERLAPRHREHRLIFREFVRSCARNGSH